MAKRPVECPKPRGVGGGSNAQVPGGMQGTVTRGSHDGVPSITGIAAKFPRHKGGQPLWRQAAPRSPPPSRVALPGAACVRQRWALRGRSTPRSIPTAWERLQSPPQRLGRQVRRRARVALCPCFSSGLPRARRVHPAARHVPDVAVSSCGVWRKKCCEFPAPFKSQLTVSTKSLAVVRWFRQTNCQLLLHPFERCRISYTRLGVFFKV